MKNEFMNFSSKRMLISMALASALAAGVSNPLFADVNGIQSVMQTVKVTGTVIGPDGYPIIGASVLEKGTSNGVITDIV